MKLDRALRYVLQLARDQIAAQAQAAMAALKPVPSVHRTYHAAVKLVEKYDRPAWMPEAEALALLNDLQRFDAASEKREYTDTEVAWDLMKRTQWLLKKSLRP